MWSALESVGRNGRTGGYRCMSWTRTDAALRERFAAEAAGRGLESVVDRGGNQWAWWGDPDAGRRAGRAGVVTGSHLDSVPEGGAFDGPLGVLSAFAAVDELRAQGFALSRPIGIVNFSEEEGARFGVACLGSRIITGALSPHRARRLQDADGTSLAEAMVRHGHPAASLGRDAETLERIGTFVELHIEQGRVLDHLGSAVAVGSSIWPHGRWRIELPGEANHAGTTRLADRGDPMLALADLITAARAEAESRRCVATVGKVLVEPNGVNAIPSRVVAWLDARGPEEGPVRELAAALGRAGMAAEESFTAGTEFDAGLVDRPSNLLGHAPVLGTGAGHDAGILARAGIPAAMLFVRNPTGVSHSPAESAEPEDCLGGVAALARPAGSGCLIRYSSAYIGGRCLPRTGCAQPCGAPQGSRLFGMSGSRPSSASAVVAALTELILDGHFAPGDQITESDLAARLGVSRTPVREAIAQLVMQGLLVKEDNRSARVHRPSLAELTEIYELRTLLECHVARLAATSASTDRIRELRALEARMRNEDGSDEWFVDHARFHRTIALAAERPRMLTTIDALRHHSEPYVRLVTALDAGQRGTAEKEHEAILQAIAEGDGDRAEELVRTHLQSTVERVRRVMDAVAQRPLAQGLVAPHA